MIRLIRGEISALEGTHLVIETASGVGYLVHTTQKTLALPGEQVQLFTHLAVRETALDLYGFLTFRELELFELLLTISGIGPKSALQIMDQADSTILVEAIKLEDPSHLTKLSGVSKKTAEKIILNLKGKLPDTTLSTPVDIDRGTSEYQDAFDTLVTLGYNPLSIRETLDNLTSFTSTSSLVTEALRQLHK